MAASRNRARRKSSFLSRLNWNINSRLILPVNTIDMILHIATTRYIVAHMSRFFMPLLLLGLSGLGIAVYQNPEIGARTRTWISNVFGDTDVSYPVDRFKVDIVDRINYGRISASQPVIRLDVDLETWLESHPEVMELDDLNHLTEKVKEGHARYLKLVACAATSSQLVDLIQEFQDFCATVDRKMTHVAIHTRRVAGGLGYQGIIVVGEKLADFSPELLSQRQTDTYFTQCPHCNYEHACKVSLDQRGINLECPKCQRSYGVLAADAHGKFRYVNEFLIGFAPPSYFPFDSNRLHEMYSIWRSVVSHCTYTKDGRHDKSKDVWQTALETQTRMHGDCEDSSVFLADWLMSRGFQVRVALGHFGDQGGHAWCVVKVDGIDYLLESTETPPDPSRPPYVSDIGARYVPETLFDRDNIYVRAKPRERFSGDYWSSKYWVKVQPRKLANERNLAENGSPLNDQIPGAPLPTVAAKPATTASTLDRNRNSAKVPMEALKLLRSDQSEWQLEMVEPKALNSPSEQPAK